MADWSVQETRCLLGIWGDADVQCKLDGVVRNKIIYGLIACELEMLDTSEHGSSKHALLRLSDARYVRRRNKT